MVAWAAAPAAQAQTVFACGPEWAALTRVLLPEARVHTATHAQQDPHHIEARPALIAQLRAADAAICTGAGLEGGWLPTLQQRAGNPRVQNGAPGLFWAASAVTLLDPRPGAGGNPFAGDIHEEGNPHLHADPRRLPRVARAWAQRLQQLFPEQQAAIGQRLTAWDAQWARRLQAWDARLAPHRGTPVVVQHASLGYLWDWMGWRPVADLEPQPGLSPTPGHLQRLLGELKARPPGLIVLGAHQDPRAARWLAGQLESATAGRGAAPAVRQLPATVPDPEAPDALGRWFDQLLDALLPPVAGAAR
ncbi:zinc ABC transporter solute-binding protein [Ideonella sp. TBM-1]|uniref:Zinc ABC transporter solute-binding protein n=2 Tax=Ideonella livida TaxID=2707176 RepID=A0A7C9TMF1_9BURK|nr:zinc ABC transporter solute-binding protein [Ideonella livida]